MSEAKTLRDALEALNGAGLYQQASELALKAARREAKAGPIVTAPTGPTRPTAEELAKPPTERGYLTHAELSAATTEQVQELREKHPEILTKSLKMLRETKGL